MSFFSHFLHHIQKKKLPIIAFGIAFFFMVFGYILGQYVQRDTYAHFLKSFRNIRENSTKYTFVNPLVGGVSAPATSVGIYTDLKDDIVSFLQGEEKSGHLLGYSFYVRDLNTGFWFGSNENIDFFPASLFKLPIALAVYKQGEDDPSFLKKMTVYTQDIAALNTAASANSESYLVVGKAYSTEELVTQMLAQSDNGAKNTLLTIIQKPYLEDLFAIVSLVNPKTTQTYAISSREYALFLRVLYGSSYLNEEHSERILSLLSESTFKDGLVAGVPQGVVVAHKFGTYDVQETIDGKSVDARQLHDCGVIYHPVNPYILCVMTKGKDVNDLFKIISGVSRRVYDYQDDNNNEN
jgi:beta-lactamase class A